MEKFCKTWQLSPEDSSDVEASRDFYKSLGLNLFMRSLMKKGKVVARFKESKRYKGKYFLIMTSEFQSKNDLLRYALGPFKPLTEWDDESGGKDHVVEMNKFISYFRLVEGDRVLKQFIIPTNQDQQVIAVATRQIDPDGNLRLTMECNGIKVHKMFTPMAEGYNSTDEEDMS